MNKSNATTSIDSFNNNSTTVPANLVITILAYVDSANRVATTLAFIFYFALVLLTKKLRSLSLLYVHHANFVGFLFVLMYMIYFATNAPNSNDPNLNDLLCRITETAWGVLKYLRFYSVLLIAIYRLAAVYFIEKFKLINRSRLALIAPIALVWLLSTSFYLAIKFAFGTTYGNLFCIDGFSTNLNDSIGYLIVSTIIAIAIPSCLVTVIYFLIRRRLILNASKANKLHRRVRLNSITSHAITANVGSRDQLRQERKETFRNTRLGHQLIALNVCYLLCFSVSFILSFRYIIPNFNEKFYYLRQILRILNISFQGLIPILSLIFNPNVSLRRLRIAHLTSVHPSYKS